MKKGDKYSLGYAIGNSILENKDKIAKLEKKVENLKNKNKKLQCKLEEKDKVIDEAMEFLKEFHNYENRFKWCEEDYIKTILKFEEILERGKNGI